MATDEAVSKQQKSNRKVIVAICGIPLLVILLSSVLYYLVNSKAVDLGTVNNGELITPPLMLPQQFQSAANEEQHSDEEPQWAYLVIGDGECLDACERMLYIARQSIIALARKMDRVKLVYINTDASMSDALATRLATEYKGVEIHQLNRAELAEALSPLNFDPFYKQQFFVVDPRGWLMMRYNVTDTSQDTLNVLGKAVIRDMRRLIK